MEKVLEQALAELINKSTQTAEQAGRFLVEQAPDVVQQVLVWNMTESLITFLVPTVLFIVSLVIFLRTLPATIKHVDDDVFNMCIIYTCVSGILSCAFLITICSTINLDWLKIWVAPKLYLIDYASDLLIK